jgi:hypothetical protein
MREEINRLTEDLEDLESQLRDVRLAQSALNVSSAALAAEQAALTAQYKQGMITEREYEKRLLAIEANMAANKASAADWTLQQSYLTLEMDRGKDATKDYEESIEGVNDAKNKMLRGWLEAGAKLGFRTGFPGGRQLMENIQSFWRALQAGTAPGAQQGGMITRTGPIFAHAGESILPRGQMMGQINLTISLAGAAIYGREGLEEALEAGGARVRKQLEYMRRPRVRW